ncbi:MAG: M56 family metallopeptidase, partial [Catalinimonas sp.]
MNHTIDILGWTLLHSLWQGALIGTVVWALRRHRRRHAAWQYDLHLGGLLLLFFTVLATAGYEWSTQTAAAPAAPLVHLTPEASTYLIATVSSEAYVAVHPWSVAYWQPHVDRALPYLTWGWALGVLICTLRWAGGRLWLRRLHKSGRAVPAWTDRVDALRRQLGIPRPVALRESVRVQVPVVVGWLKPVIFVPVGLLTHLPPAQVEMVLRHELAHVRRHDYLVNAFQMLIETLLFYHPVVWLLSAQVRIAREHCCDDLALHANGNAAALARALLRVQEGVLTPPTFARRPALALLGSNGGS